MRELRERVAFVTGAAQGIGLGIARALAAAGMHVALADIQAGRLAAAEAEVAAFGGRTLSVALDVADRAAVFAAAQRVQAALGPVFLLVNNAGVCAPPKPISIVSADEWAWMVGVNLYGPIHGVAAFLPPMRRRGEGGYILNTASIGGLQVRTDLNTGAYAATKHAVVAFSESLRGELAESGIGVGVLCPAAVNTAIYRSGALRPARYGGPIALPDDTPNEAELRATGISADDVGRRALAAIRDDEFLILTHAEARPWVAARYRRIDEAFERASVRAG